jgi:hypothetical protein
MGNLVWKARKSVPQWLKPSYAAAPKGTAKPVPFVHRIFPQPVKPCPFGFYTNCGNGLQIPHFCSHRGKVIYERVALCALE